MLPSDQRRSYAVLEAPSTYGLTAKGVEQLPATLLEHGLATRLQARHAGRVEPLTPRSNRRDPSTGVMNAAAIVSYARSLADGLAPLLDANEFPIVLGGDCSIVLGSTLALRRRGRFGLLFIDGQADFFQPDAEPHGEAASMDLAFVTGYGPEALTRIEGLSPLIQPADAVQFGFRDADDQAEYGSQPLPTALRAFDLPTIRRMGIDVAARAAVAHLVRDELEGFFIHIDADCLDDALMPAVDFRLPDGLSAVELETIVRLAMDSKRAVGMEITIYNPTLDPDGRAGALLTDVIVRALSA